MKAVIVAAGRSSRLYPLTLETPKGLLQVGGSSLLERSVTLLQQRGIDDIVMVVGYQHEKLRAALGNRVRFLYNPFFAETNNLGSLWIALPHLQDQAFVYLHGDVIYSPALLDDLVHGTDRQCARLSVDMRAVDDEAMKVRLHDGRFAESSKQIPLDSAVGEWTGLARICGSLVRPLHAAAESILAQRSLQAYDTAAFNLLARDGVEFAIVPTRGMPWMEIDTHADLQAARELFEEPSGE